MQPSRQAQYEWQSGDFCRDTLTFFLGSLVESVLLAAFRESSIVSQYQDWLRELNLPGETDATRPLLETGFDNVTLTLLARDRTDEFCVVIDSSKFSLTIPAGFDSTCGVLKALWIARFDGCVHTALQASSSLRLQINQQLLQPRGSARHCH